MSEDPRSRTAPRTDLRTALDRPENRLARAIGKARLIREGHYFDAEGWAFLLDAVALVREAAEPRDPSPPPPADIRDLPHVFAMKYGLKMHLTYPETMALEAALSTQLEAFLADPAPPRDSDAALRAAIEHELSLIQYGHPFEDGSAAAYNHVLSLLSASLGSAKPEQEEPRG